MLTSLPVVYECLRLCDDPLELLDARKSHRQLRVDDGVDRELIGQDADSSCSRDQFAQCGSSSKTSSNTLVSTGTIALRSRASVPAGGR